MGAFRRSRTDRAIHHSANDDEATRQSRQIERDLDNLNWLLQACDEALTSFCAAEKRARTFLATDEESKGGKAGKQEK